MDVYAEGGVAVSVCLKLLAASYKPLAVKLKYA
jgi:hypothetical protein